MSQNTLKRLKEYLVLRYYKLQCFPTNKEVCDYLNIDDSLLQKYYQYLIKKRFIQKTNNEWIIPETEIDNYYPKTTPDPEEDEPLKESVEKPVIVVKKHKKKNRKKLKTKIKGHLFLRILLLPIGLGATYMSIMYSAHWFMSFLSQFNAILLSCIMVIYAVGSFELIVFFYIRKHRIVSGVFAFLWIVVTLFSMTSTVAGQYNSRMQDIEKAYSEKNKIFQNEKQLQDWKDEKELLDHELSLVNTEISRIQKALLQFTTLEQIDNNRRLYNSLYWQRRQAIDKKQTTMNRLEDLRNNKPEELLKKDDKNFYEWISSIFILDASIIQFWLSVFPALFIDLIAPFSFAVILYTKN